ncbi:MAG: DJ-1/PfpI family protein [Elusimicrobiota bacterium]|jgi:protease I|nr:DJ-1/PfpI family protein [Elusimicrobiota bacterium]
MKKALFVVQPDTFRDEEYFEPKKILEDAGVKVITASLKLGEMKGKLGRNTTAEILLQDVKADDFDAIVYIGGGGADTYYANADAFSKPAKEFFADGKITASICIAGIILAGAGVLKGKKATSFIDGKDALLKGGADFTGKSVEIDGNIITANGPTAASDFGKAILEALNL